MNASTAAWSWAPFFESLEGRLLLSITFEPPREIPAPGETRAALVIDLNHDNKPDVLVSDSAGVGVYDNVGNGNLAPRRSLSTEVGFTALLIDLNGDGRRDLLSARGGRLSILYDDGVHPFTPALWFVPTGFYADFNADGQLDLAVDNQPAASAPNLFQIALSNGHGGIGLPQDTASLAVGQVFTADLNADGDIDILSGSTAFTNDGTGHFPTIYWRSIPSTWGSTFILADFNGDSRPDWAIASANVAYNNGSVRSGAVNLFINTSGSGSVRFSVSQSYYNPSATSMIGAGDFNGDGRTDILLGGRWLPNQSHDPAPTAIGQVFLNLPNGLERATIERSGAPPGTAGAWTVLPASGDLNNDGFDDIIASRDGALGIIENSAGDIGPRIGSVQFREAGATFGEHLTITAADVRPSPGAAIESVRFYRDANHNSLLDAQDVLLGEDRSPLGGWSIRPKVSVAWGRGDVTIFAKVTDSHGRVGVTSASVQTVVQSPPTMSAVSVTQEPVRYGLNGRPLVTVNAAPVGLSDPNGAVLDVSYYVDRNSNGALDNRDVLVRRAVESDAFAARFNINLRWLRWGRASIIAVARDPHRLVSDAVLRVFDVRL